MAQNNASSSTENQKPKNICVVDGNSLMHRAYHAIPGSMKAPEMECLPMLYLVLCPCF